MQVTSVYICTYKGCERDSVDGHFLIWFLPYRLNMHKKSSCPVILYFSTVVPRCESSRELPFLKPCVSSTRNACF